MGRVGVSGLDPELGEGLPCHHTWIYSNLFTWGLPHPVNWQNDTQADRHNSKHSLLAISLSGGKNVNLQTTDS